MRNLPQELAQLLPENIVRPVLLVEIHFSNILYLSSYKSLVWNDINWLKSDIDIRSFSFRKNGIIEGSLSIGNTGNSINYYVLNEGITNKVIKIFLSYFDEEGNLAEPFNIFHGIGDKSEITTLTTIISFTNEFLDTSRSPRFRICKENGFNWLPKPGTKLTWNNQTIILYLER